MSLPTTTTAADDQEQFIVPDWVPSTPDEIMNLGGALPPDCTASPSASLAHVLSLMRSGQRFFQYFSSATGAQVRKNILVFYVEDPTQKTAGKLYWSERSRKSISQNRCLPLDKITDIYLGAQTAVLKRATDTAAAAGTNAVAPNEALLFSLLSDTTMLDLEATGMRELCYWLFGLSVIMNAHDRSVHEKEAVVGGAASNEDVLNSSMRSAGDTSMDLTDSEMDSLKREMDETRHRRRHTRKFSVAVVGGGNANDSFHHEEMTSTLISTSASSAQSTFRQIKLQTNPVAPLRHSFQQLRQSVQGELQSMSNYLTQSMQQVLTRARQSSSTFSALEESLATEQRKRRRLQNKLIELQGNIRVFARVRPLSAAEEQEGSCIEFVGENTLALVQNGESKPFEFDRVYTPEARQADVFKDVAPFVQSAVDGFSVCVFAYGQTGAGKSYTMEGPPSDPGVNSRAMAELFQLTSSSKTAGYTYEVTVSVVEIYNETLRDLLTLEKEKNRPKLDVRQGTDGVYVPDLTEIKVSSVEEVQHLMTTRATPNRSVAATNMNEYSSRSHCCVFIKVTGTNGIERTAGRLVLIDLAGSERLARSGVEGQAAKEACAINASLSALGNVISSLQVKSAHVPYRNSKLTWLLSDCLSGQSKCLMFVQLNPTTSSHQESSCSLQFAMRAKQTDLGKAKKNKTLAGADVQTLKKSVATAEAERKKVKEESKAEQVKLLKQLKTQTEQFQDLQQQLQFLQQQMKQVEKERDAARGQITTIQSTSSMGVTALHEQIRVTTKENVALKDKMNAANAQHLALLQAKEKEIKELRMKAASQPAAAPTPPITTKAWESDSTNNKRTAIPSKSTKSRSAAIVAADDDMEFDQENGGMGSSQRAIPAAATSFAGKKRRSGETTGPVFEESQSKRQAIEREDVASSALTRPRTAGASRIAAPSSNAAPSGATTARNVKRPLPSTAAATSTDKPSVSNTSTPISRVTRAALARPNITPVPIMDEATSLIPVPMDTTDAPDTDSTPMAQSSPTNATGRTLSVTEQAMAKLEERRLKFKAERALLNSKKAPNASGWKM